MLISALKVGIFLDPELDIRTQNLFQAVVEGRMNEIHRWSDEKTVSRLDTRPTSRGRTVLHWSAYGGCYECLTWLLDNFDLDLNIHDYFGFTPAELALHEGYISIVDLLLRRGAESPRVVERVKSLVFQDFY